MEAMQTSLRDFPFPYRSMLSIVNDIDDTELKTFKTLHQFLNTKEDTKWGVGVGLDVADSFWMFGPPDKPAVMSWWKGHGWNIDNHSAEIAHFVRSGWIDSIHTWGDFSRVGGFSRQHAIQAVETLSQAQISVPVWINHGDSYNRQNFPGHLSLSGYMRGDHPTAPEYSSDLAKQIGALFVQSHDVDQMGHDFPLAPVALANGTLMWGFVRSSKGRPTFFFRVLGAVLRRAASLLGKPLVNDPGSFWLWHPHRLHKQISPENLNAIAKNRQFAIVAQHLGYLNNDLPKTAVSSLRLLERRFRDGEILVCRTSRLLRYAVTREYVKFEVSTKASRITYNIVSIDDPVTGTRIPLLDELRGLCFMSDDAPEAEVRICDNKVDEKYLSRDFDHNFVQIKWYEEDIVDYTKF